MACPNCNSNNIWDDNGHWGCDNCKWCSLAGLNSTRTPSQPYSMYRGPDDTEARARDWARRDAGE